MTAHAHEIVPDGHAAESVVVAALPRRGARRTNGRRSRGAARATRVPISAGEFCGEASVGAATRFAGATTFFVFARDVASGTWNASGRRVRRWTAGWIGGCFSGRVCDAAVSWLARARRAAAWPGQVAVRAVHTRASSRRRTRRTIQAAVTPARARTARTTAAGSGRTGPRRSARARRVSRAARGPTLPTFARGAAIGAGGDRAAAGREREEKQRTHGAHHTSLRLHGAQRSKQQAIRQPPRGGD
jgi:hypothetical protein